MQDLVENEKSQQRKERRELGSNPSCSIHTFPTASALSSHSNTAMFPPPLELRRDRVAPPSSDSGAGPSSSKSAPTVGEKGSTVVNRRERGWVPTALSAGEPEPVPQDIVVDDGHNPVRNEHRVPRIAPSARSGEE